MLHALYHLYVVCCMSGAFAPLIGAFAALLFALAILYFTKYLWPVNYLSLLLFTAAQTFFYGGMSLYFDTRMGWVILVFVAAFTGIKGLLLTCGGSCFGHGASNRYKKVTLFASLPPLGVLIWAQLRYELMAVPIFAGVVGFCIVLSLWFGFETRNLCEKLSPDEYMQAIVLYYTDM
jgi:hypothetical protein